MHTEIKCLFREQAEQVKLLAERIAALVTVRTIVLFGIRTHHSMYWSTSPIFREPD